jgi:hypothetical protein
MISFEKPPEINLSAGDGESTTVRIRRKKPIRNSSSSRARYLPNMAWANPPARIENGIAALRRKPGGGAPRTCAAASQTAVVPQPSSLALQVTMNRRHSRATSHAQATVAS